MRVLLIQPPIEDFYLTPIRTYPLNLIYLASVLESIKEIDINNFSKKERIGILQIIEYLETGRFTPIYRNDKLGST